MADYLSYEDTLIGPHLDAIKAIRSYSGEEWEEFIEEWLDIKKESYVEVERLGGAGDMGRDVVAYINKNNPNYEWDCYQCKHYQDSLAPNKVWVEFGKIIYYSFKGEYPKPNKYYFVAPKGVGTKLSDLLNNQVNLKNELMQVWDDKCKDEIANSSIELVGDFLDYFNNFDFSIFGRVQVKDVIKEHKKHQNHIRKFGGGLPAREKRKPIPTAVQSYEVRYTQQLTLAYNSDKETNSFTTVDDFKGDSIYDGHFNRARESFHNAEQLRNFSRDNLGQDVFDDLQEEIYQRVVDIADEDTENGFKKAKEVEAKAMELVIESNALKSRCLVTDKKGICHQLVNDNRFNWVKDDE